MQRILAVIREIQPVDARGKDVQRRNCRGDQGRKPEQDDNDGSQAELPEPRMEPHATRSKRSKPALGGLGVAFPMRRTRTSEARFTNASTEAGSNWVPVAF